MEKITWPDRVKNEVLLRVNKERKSSYNETKEGFLDYTFLAWKLHSETCY